MSTLLTLMTTENQLKLTYLIFGTEQVTTLHLQGYLELEKKRTLRKVKTILKRAHWEASRGTPTEAADYCKKDGQWKESGTLQNPGKRSDLEEIRIKIKEGASEVEIAEQDFPQWCLYRRSFKRYKQLIALKRSWKTVVVVLWGDTGVGKTRFVMNQVMDQSIWIPGDYSWFDGYEGQEIVLFDDYRGEYPLQMFLKLTDRYQMKVPVKGDFAEWAPKKIYITSNTSPATWYRTADDRSQAAFWRRLEIVTFINKNIY